MKWLWCSVFLLSMMSQSVAQSSQRRNWERLSTNDYVEGSVLVKVKSGFQSSFEQHIARARTSNFSYSSNSFAKGSIKSQSRFRLKNPVIDISLYYEVRFPREKSLTSITNELYALGFVELVEPVFKEAMQITPNDPLVTNQYYLEKIKAFEAWEITEGSEDLIIAIVDSGVDVDHPDLVDKLFINVDDPINGIDDDGNGFVDDYRGWDFSGDNASLIGTEGFTGDNDVAIYKDGSGFVHGTMVGGIAAASVDNEIGIAGVAKRSKLLFTKHYADDQATDSRTYSSNLYQGVIYAAEMGAKIINCSWGSSFRSQIYQDIITYVSVDLGCLVVAAAGNSNEASPLYPAAYDYVLSVASSDELDKRSSFSNYGSTIDLIAPGSNIVSTTYNDQYASSSGTSLAAPIVAGAAALVWSHYPEYSGLQIGELLRTTADESVYASNLAYKNKLGKGRLDIHRALTLPLGPAVRIVKHVITNQHGSKLEIGEQAHLFLDVKNYLHPTNQLTVEISTTHAGVTINRNSVSLGSIAQGSVARNVIPFEISFTQSIQQNASIDFLVKYRDSDYEDYETFSVVPFQTYIDIDYNQVSLSVSSTGKLGFENTSQSSGGRGFIFDDTSMLFEMGLIMGTSSSTLWNSVRSTPTSFDDDFVTVQSIREMIPGEKADAEATGTFSNDKNPENQKVLVNYKTYAWIEEPYDHFIVLEYEIENRTSTNMDNFYLGLFSDWDISNEGATDEAGWLMDLKTGYIKPKNTSSILPIGGIQLLSDKPNYYAIDNDPATAGSAIGLYDGFTDVEKFLALSNSVIKTQAGLVNANGGDVSHIVSSGPYRMEAGEKIKVAFAVHGVKTLSDLERSASHADTMYNYILKATMPVIDTVTVCYNGIATIKPLGEELYHWYDQRKNGTLVHVGNELTIENLKHDTILYVSSVYDGYESLRSSAHIRVASSPKVIQTGGDVLCKVDPIILTASLGDQYLWNNGATTQSIIINEPGEYFVTVSSTIAGMDCENSSTITEITALERPIADMHVAQNENVYSFSFTDESENAVSWRWNFGDGSTSTSQSPTHIYSQPDTYTVELIVTNSIGCEDKVVEVISTIVGLEHDNLVDHIEIYPIPTDSQIYIESKNRLGQRLYYTIYTTLGHTVKEGELTIETESKQVINLDDLSNGLYLIRIHNEKSNYTKRIIIKR